MSAWVLNRKGVPQFRRHFLTDNRVAQVERCMSVMQSGTQMVKLKTGSKGLVRLFYLDEHRSCIRWKPSRKSEKAKITIDSLYKVTEGGQSDIFHRHAEGSLDPACCFTVYHGNHMESLDLVTSNSDEARTWVTGLRYLMAGISDEDSLAKRQRSHDQWMKQTFEEADKNGDGLLNIDEIYQLLHKLNVNLPRRKVKQMFQEADTDDQQGTLTYDEFSVFYKMMSMRRDLFLLMMAYSDRKDHLTADELANMLRCEQKMVNVTPEYAAEIIDKFEVSDENKQKGVMGIEGFTSFMRSPTCDIFNPLHNDVNQDMDQPLCNYFIASSHNTYLTGDQLLSHSKTDMYAWVLQSGCRCVEVDCWDGPDGEPMVQHGYTLTSKITFKSVIETINKYAFINNQFPVLLSIENHCSIQQQKKIAQYLREVFADKLDVAHVLSRESKTLPSPQSLQGKILIKGKRLPAYLSADAEEGEVSDDDSADEIEDDFKLKNSNGNGHQHQVESHIRKKLDSLLKESRIGDKEDTDSFSIRALLRATHQGLQKNLRQNSRGGLKKSQSRSFITTLKQKRHSKSRLTCQSVEKEEDEQETSMRDAGGQFNRGGRKRKTMKLSRDLSNLVVFTNSVASQECLNEGTPGDVLSFSETRAQSLVNHRAEHFLAFNQRQLSRIYPSAYRIDSSNFNPQFYWNVGCQLVALNYQTEGRMMQLNRAKFMVNGGSGYVLKPPPMCKGTFNPFSDDPLPACPKKQLVLKVISGQHLPKPPDSMLGDRGEIIDPFVEVEIIGLPIDCCKEQTRVVDDNGFNPVWEETLSFTLHMAEVALVRFLVWDHDPIGRDFIGQRTVAFSSLMPGYRHVYLEGLTEASIFVHVSVHDVYGKWSPLVLNPSFTIMHFLGSSKGNQLRGIRGLFNRSSKSSVDTNSTGLRKRSISDHLLRRTASAPAKGRKKTKMALSESAASMLEHKNGAGLEAVGEGVSGKEAGVEKRPQGRPLLTHRPISMPLDRLLQGQLTLCSGDKEHDLSANAVIGTFPFDRPRSSSVDLLTKSSASIHESIQTPSKLNSQWKKELNKPQEASYLVVGGDNITNEDDYVNYQAGINRANLSKTHSAPSTNNHCRSEKPETTSTSTVFTIAPSVSSSSSCSVAPLSPVNCDRDLKSPSSLHDSTISRLIDAMSLGNEQDTQGSISALIGQFESTADQNEFNSFCNRTFSPSGQLQDVTSTSAISAKQKTLQITTPRITLSPCTVPQVDSAILSSPETTDLEEVYTILDEETLSPPVSAYNLKNQSVNGNANILGNKPSSNLAFSPVKVVQGLGSRQNVCCNVIPTNGRRNDDPEEIEESVYEEVFDPPAPITEQQRSSTQRYMLSPVNQSFQLSNNRVGNAFAEVEVNVDEDPTEVSLTSPRCTWKARSSPTKQTAIYQNESTPKYSKQRHPLPYREPQQYPTYSPIPSSYFKPTYQCIDQQCNLQSSPMHRPMDSKPSRPRPLSHNGYPSSQSNTLRYNRDLTQQTSYNGSLILNGFQQDGEGNEIPNGFHQVVQGHRAAEPGRFLQNGFSTSENLPIPSSRVRCLSFHTAYSHFDNDNVTDQCSVSQSRSQSQNQVSTPNHTWNQNVPVPQIQSETKAPKISTVRSLSTGPQSNTVSCTVSTPCKSKSLGDLTSEDISCNFQSKYHIISRSFITPHMRKHKRMGTMGGGTLQSQSRDPLTEQLRKLVNFEVEDGEKEMPPYPQCHMDVKSPWKTSTEPPTSKGINDSPPLLARRLSSRSQSRVRHINNRARERQQEALKPPSGGTVNGITAVGGVVLRNKPTSQNSPVNRHSTGSYIAGYFGQLEDRGLPEGACTSSQFGNGDQQADLYCAGDPLPSSDSSYFSSEPETTGFTLKLDMHCTTLEVCLHSHPLEMS
ncbi:1-phosphatidylinositol 4,5-bisphosphate phosphodiesterase eta-1 isoform X2 [Corythoichthys intestinalis]|uniref:1-phosphatidylinositol 4,5-bisphosphate phosphodiesterase eta-1 isoform X2 n=1 Tax=Corythoichthys intestinalis TaxID=161448 RepID=UPI0025A4DF43|nr:1-phosphatidylinositol 4,5-bisphosphate phosphodiesterase eta-1 isoform X2 [Corythoichthys intestinalis]